jgi:hypothetical protein
VLTAWTDGRKISVMLCASNVVITIQWTHFWYKYTTCLHALHVSAYWGHHQVHMELIKSPFFLPAVPPYTGQCLHIGSAFYRYVVYVIPLCYKMY